ncbi:MAG: hypothetical protein R3E95_17915 [Thiolinea sp.]
MITVDSNGYLSSWDVKERKARRFGAEQLFDQPNASVLALSGGNIISWSTKPGNKQQFKIWNEDDVEKGLIKTDEYVGHDAVVILDEDNKLAIGYRSLGEEATLWSWDKDMLRPIVDRFILPGRLMAVDEESKTMVFLMENNRLTDYKFDDFTPDGLRKRACKVANRELQLDEWRKYVDNKYIDLEDVKKPCESNFCESIKGADCFHYLKFSGEVKS